MIIMWWWDPKVGAGTAVEVSLFEDAFEEATGMESIGGWNFSAGGYPVENPLNTGDPDLWTAITNKNNDWINPTE